VPNIINHTKSPQAFTSEQGTSGSENSQAIRANLWIQRPECSPSIRPTLPKEHRNTSNPVGFPKPPPSLPLVLSRLLPWSEVSLFRSGRLAWTSGHYNKYQNEAMVDNYDMRRTSVKIWRQKDHDSPAKMKRKLVRLNWNELIFRMY